MAHPLTRHSLTSRDGSQIEQHPVTLRFLDDELEAAFVRTNADRNVSYYRLGYVVVLSILVSFGAVEVLLFPKHFKVLWLIRYGFLVPSIILLGPVILSERWRPMLVEKQSIIVGGTCTWMLGCVGLMSVIIFFDDPVGSLIFLGPMYIFLTMSMFYLSRLRFMHSAVVLLPSYVIGMSIVVLGADLSEPSLWSLMVAGTLANLVGLIGTQQMEVFARKEFIASQAIEGERAAVERLLLNILPRPIALRLRDDEEPIADDFDNVTVLFADIVGFTELANRLPAKALVQLLDSLFSEFDLLTDEFGVEKIKTIGDCYMAAAGIPTPQSNHANNMASLALAMMEIVRSKQKKGLSALDLRIGVCSGPVVAGVIGRRKFIYDLWGDTVNTAARMESHGLTGRIQISESTKVLLSPRYELEERGEIDIKGKGPMSTFWLVGSSVNNMLGSKN